MDFSDTATQIEGSQADTSLEAFRRGFKPLHKAQSTLMYFSVCFASTVKYPVLIILLVNLFLYLNLLSICAKCPLTVSIVVSLTSLLARA